MANQIVTRTNSNSAYDYSAHTLGTDAYVANGLNQYTSVAGTSFAHDLRGNLTNNGVKTFTYDYSNRLKTVTGGISYSYDPLSRLYQQTVGSTSTQYLYDGSDLIAEYNGSSVQKRYVHGPGLDEPLVEYQGGTEISRSHHQDGHTQYGVPITLRSYLHSVLNTIKRQPPLARRTFSVQVAPRQIHRLGRRVPPSV